MARFVVPRAFRKGLNQLLNLDHESQQRLLESLSSQEPRASTTSLTSHVTTELGDAIPAQVDEVTRAIIGIYLGLYVYDERPVADAVEDILRSQETDFPEENRERLKDYLSKIFSIEALVVTAKAASLVSENANLFINARIVTDIRPVFAEPPSEIPAHAPVAAVILQTLRIGYYEKGEPKEFYVTLNASNVRELQEALRRADSKAQILQSGLPPSIRYLSVETE